ncbi:hypothetical protein JCM1841_002963 [Sporobolomyces salmonicolor]
MTTQTLHARLHQLGEPLPSRPPPANFLQGAGRNDPSRTRSRKPPVYPGKDESSDGRWSMSYLKRHILAGMEGRGEIIKLTRHKWEAVAAAAGIETKPADPEVAPETPTTVKAEPLSKSQAQAQAKRESDHIWVLKSMWTEASRKAAENQPSKRVQRAVRDEVQLREKYGLGSGTQA